MWNSNAQLIRVTWLQTWVCRSGKPEFNLRRCAPVADYPVPGDAAVETNAHFSLYCSSGRPPVRSGKDRGFSLALFDLWPVAAGSDPRPTSVRPIIAARGTTTMKTVRGDRDRTPMIAHTLTRLSWTIVVACAGSASGGQISVLSVQPSSNALNIARDAEIIVRFDRPVEPSTVTAANLWAAGRWSGGVVGSIQLSDGDRVATLSPITPFSAGESVTVGVTNGIRGADGSSMRAAGYASQFWTRTVPTKMNYELSADRKSVV